MGLSTSWKAASRSATKKFFKFYWARSFNTIFTGDLYWSLSLARWIQSTQPQSDFQIPVSIYYYYYYYLLLLFIYIIYLFISIIIIYYLPTYRFLPCGLLHAWCVPRLSCACYMFHLSHPPSLDHCNDIWRRVKWMKFVMQFSTFHPTWVQIFSSTACSHVPP
jgi:hypothetical protein